MAPACYLCLCYVKKSKRPEPSQITQHRFPKDEETRRAWIKACGLLEGVDDISKIRICSLHFVYNDYVEPRAKTFGGRLILRQGAVPSVYVPYPQPSLIRNTYEAPTSNDANSQICTPKLEGQVANPIKNEAVALDGTETCENNEHFSESSDNTAYYIEKGAPIIKTEVVDGIETYGNVVDCNSESPDNSDPFYGINDIGNTEFHLNNIQDFDDNTEELQNPSKKRRWTMPRYINEITVSDMATPKGAHRVLNLVRRTNVKKSMKIKALQNQNRLLLKKISSIEAKIKELMEKRFLKDEDALMVSQED